MAAMDVPRVNVSRLLRRIIRRPGGRVNVQVFTRLGSVECHDQRLALPGRMYGPQGADPMPSSIGHQSGALLYLRPSVNVRPRCPAAPP
jgi:hypothetical protein